MASISLRVLKPESNALVGDELDIQARITSTNALQSVTASVSGRTISLVYDPSPGMQVFVGTISLAGLPRGTLTLTVTAQDVTNATETSDTPFVHDTPPVLTVLEPAPHEVAHPTVHVKILCADDDPAGCSSISAGNAVVNGQSMLEADVSFPEIVNGTETLLAITGIDSAGQQTTRTIAINVDLSNRIVDIAHVPGEILDFDATRILYFDELNNRLKIRDRAAGTDAVIDELPGQRISRRGFLTPRGAIFVGENFTYQNGHYSPQVLTAAVFEWFDGTLVTHGFADTDYALRCAGNYAVWTGDLGLTRTGRTSLFIRDFTQMNATPTEVRAPGDHNAGNNGPDVAPDGTVTDFYSADGYTDVFLWKNGLLTQITDGPGNGQRNFYPLTDGQSTLFVRKTPYPAFNIVSLMKSNGMTENTLIAPRSTDNAPDLESGLDYQINTGWIAVTRFSPGNINQVWRISPMGTEQMVTTFGTASRIDKLGNDGTLTFTHASARHLWTPSTSFVTNSALGRAVQLGGKWYVVIGTRIFIVAMPAAPVMSSANPSTYGGSVTFTAGVPSGATGTVTFYDGSVVLGSAPVSGSSAAFTTSTLSAGSHSITALYSGDATHDPTMSDSLTQTVNKAASSVTLGATPNPSNHNDTVTFTATVGAGLTGNVSFLDGTATLGTVPLDNNGVAMFSTTTLSGGQHSITAVYSGDANHYGSTSAPLTQSVILPFGTPEQLNAVPVSVTSISLTWVPVSDAAYYQIIRRSNGGVFSYAGAPANPPFVDNGLIPNTTYIYEVRAVSNDNALSDFSPPDAATTIVFTDDPLVAGQTVIKRVHLTELRTAVNAMRAAGNLAVFTFSEANPVLVEAIHIQELRSALAEARNAIGVAPITFTDPSLAAGQTVKAVHFTELREGCK